jgi:hypothetical protein
MAGNSKNIVVGAARIFISYGTNTSRPSLIGQTVFPWSVNVDQNSGLTSASNQSTASFLSTTASTYWRDLGFTSTGAEISYEPGYSDVTVDQLLDAARLFQQSLKVTLKTELDEATFENMNIVWGQQEQILNAGSAFKTVPVLSSSSGTAQTSASTNFNQLNIVAGALGIQPVERTLVLVGNTAGAMGQTTTYPSASSGSAVIQSTSDISGIKAKERVYVARRVIQEQTTAHALKRDAATVFPVQFRCLPDTDRNEAAGSEYGFVVDRIYGS